MQGSVWPFMSLRFVEYVQFSYHVLWFFLLDHGVVQASSLGQGSFLERSRFSAGACCTSTVLFSAGARFYNALTLQLSLP